MAGTNQTIARRSDAPNVGSLTLPDSQQPITDTSTSPFRTVLGIRFYTGNLPGLVELTKHGGLVAVPSAPVLVDLVDQPAHRTAVEGCDFAITDSGFMVWIWFFRHGEWLERISGLKYIRALMEERDFRESGAVFWVMPSADDAYSNMAWLQKKGLKVRQVDMYIAPVYPKTGPLEDPALLAAIEAAKPRYVVMCLGGGVQERLGYYLKQELWIRRFGKRESGNLTPEITRHSGISSQPSREPQASEFKFQPSADYRPAIICTGAAIAFLSGRQANIPPWADRAILGWFFRCLNEPMKFIPRYWRSLRLITILWRFGAKSAGEAQSAKR